MNTFENRLAKLDKGQIQKIDNLENELGFRMIALDSEVFQSEITPDQLTDLQALEKEMDAVLVATGPFRNKVGREKSEKSIVELGEKVDLSQLKAESTEFTENQKMKVQSLEKELAINLIVLKPSDFQEEAPVHAELNKPQLEKLQVLENKLGSSVIAFRTSAG
jgi:hypothetical protein